MQIFKVNSLCCSSMKNLLKDALFREKKFRTYDPLIMIQYLLCCAINTALVKRAMVAQCCNSSHGMLLFRWIWSTGKVWVKPKLEKGDRFSKGHLCICPTTQLSSIRAPGMPEKWGQNCRSWITDRNVAGLNPTRGHLPFSSSISQWCVTMWLFCACWQSILILCLWYFQFRNKGLVAIFFIKDYSMLEFKHSSDLLPLVVRPFWTNQNASNPAFSQLRIKLFYRICFWSDSFICITILKFSVICSLFSTIL